jgi:hypothetical protein
VVLRAPVRVIFQVENRSAEAITIDLGSDRQQNFVLAMQQPDGDRVAIPPPPMREGIHSRGMISIRPGERVMQPILVNERTNLDSPGTYELRAELSTPIEAANGTRTRAIPWRGIVNVLPYDAGKLKEVCEKLASEIEASASVREAVWAATALGHVADPVAVPYLDRALQSGKYIETPAIEGLVRIGNVDAVNVLRKIVAENPGWPPDTSSSVGTRSIKAVQGLQAIATKSADPAARREAEAALPRGMRSSGT